MKDNANVILSICMLTYNHEKWIGKAIEGVLMQKTNFNFELIIGEDCSNDRTREIVLSYSRMHPQIIRTIFNKNNLGLAKNFSQILTICKGKYIAICEGDDFWTNPHKLQYQVDFLEENPNCTIVSHNASRYYEEEGLENNLIKFGNSFQFDQKRYLEEWLTQPLTCVFRNIFRDYTYFNKENDIFCDVILFYELLKHGYGYFMREDMATFRVHKKALSSGLSRWQWLYNHIIMFDYLYKYNNRDELLQTISRNYCLSIYIYNLSSVNRTKHNFKPLKEYLRRNPGFREQIIVFGLRIPFYIVKYGILFRLKSFMSTFI
jgi:glycosyltransferase involved in cell wall biosynthesis